MNPIPFDPKTTALVLIDLQHGNVGRPLAPYSGSAVVERCAKLAEKLREQGGTIVYVRVNVHELLHLPADAPLRAPGSPPPPAEASELVPEAGMQPSDVVVTKRQWGAFYGTDLEQQLRRRGIRTLMLGGIATNIGVESTARAAFDQGYELVFVEDAMTSISEDAHRFATQHIFPRMGYVRSTSDVLAALG
ncbi:hydrolase [Trinickia terrae]|uniref:Hydrolase n=1 Tax=Trinickia terrae TaxID=2571161 RepID=A0A4V5PH20_9BURK|nr:hydrolase [Trinickia terrae]TKC81700.1 hydrolase [Trinickia terrae]